MQSSLNLFQSFISGSVHKVLKYNRKYKIMFNKRKKKAMFMYNFINNKDSFLNISHTEVFDCLYFWIYMFRFCRVFLFTKVFIVFKGREFSFSKPLTAIFCFTFKLLNTIQNIK